MPVVAREGEFKFVIYVREQPYEPPHVHVQFGGEEVRIDLNSGDLMDEPPAGKRRAILEAYRKHARKIRKAWARYHGGR